jgi:hypothetical protein
MSAMQDRFGKDAQASNVRHFAPAGLEVDVTLGDNPCHAWVRSESNKAAILIVD